MAKLSFWERYRELLVFTILAVILLGLVVYGGLNRAQKINHLSQLAQEAGHLGDHQQSYQLLKEAIELAPNNPSLHFQLSQLYKNTNNWPEAQKELLIALELSPDSLSIKKELTGVQKTLLEPKQVEEELTFWKKEIAAKPDYRDGWIQLAVRYYELYQLEDAKIALSKAYQLDPNFEATKKLMEVIN